MQTHQQVAAMKAAGAKPAMPMLVKALIDTGASCSALDISLVRGLGLIFREAVRIHTPSSGPERHLCNQYDASLAIGGKTDQPLERTLFVIESDLESQGIYALIGLDILADCAFVSDGPSGRFSLSW